MFTTIEFKEEKLFIIDQTKLPTELIILGIDNVIDCYDAIKKTKS